MTVMSGCAAFSSSSAARMRSATSTSPAPLARTISKPTTGLPFRKAPLRFSASVSLTVAMVRTDCSAPPSVARPPGASCCTCLSWRDTSAAVAPRASRRAGSSSTCSSRVTPPTRATEPTPRTDSRRLATWLSTNQLSASSSMLLLETV